MQNEALYPHIGSCPQYEGSLMHVLRRRKVTHVSLYIGSYAEVGLVTRPPSSSSLMPHGEANI